MIDVKKQYRTREGFPVRIYAIDGGGGACIHGAVEINGYWFMRSWYKNGGSHDIVETKDDLVEVKKRILRDVWVNIYPDNTILGVHHSKEKAALCGMGRIACVQLEIDCREGDGAEHDGF